MLSTDHAYEVYTLELGPCDSLAELHGELSNHAGTFANEVSVTAGAVVISISHSVIAVDGRWWASVVTTTDEGVDP
ncbi:hypothetical protein LQ384_28530 [Rhodococcus rhodochrous]|uniref:Uncharacterized protein n=1 Tax=Rhodococcus rhodochrous TaxID=1829 RepID=A0AAW4XPC0_RHORH|nr:hypothetical protein [Rhodococcus rhodochrous]MCD2115025.1 hypothetical protein [Rhodococcus rhodochrous]